MSTSNISDRPSVAALFRYSRRKFQVLYKPEFKGLTLSSTSSRDSLSSRTNSTPGTEFSEDDNFDIIEDLRVRDPGADMLRSWTPREKEFLGDLTNVLREEPSLSGHKYMLRLNFAGKSGESWRPCVLLLTQSAKTKLTLASYLLTSPPVLRRVVGCGLDIHIVHQRFGLSSSAEDMGHSMSDYTVPQVWVETNISTNGARLVVEHAVAGRTTTAVADGVFLVGGRMMLLTTHHPFKLDENVDEGCFEQETSPLILDSTHTIDGAISIYHEDIEDDIVRLDCADAALDEFTSYTDGGKGMEPSCGHSTSGSSNHRSLKQLLANMKDTLMPAKSKRDDEVERSIPQKTRVPWNSQPHRNKDIRHSNLIPGKVVHTGASLDWSALELMPRDGWYHSLFRRLNRIGGHDIDSILDIEVSSPINVTLGTPDGDVSGRLLPDTIFLHVGGKDLELQVVRLDKPLQRGTSGSWVTHCNQFCGMVVAISDDLPEAFILPANVSVNDMEKISCAKVTLPTSSYVRQPNLRSCSPPTESRNSTATIEPYGRGIFMKCTECRKSRQKCIRQDSTLHKGPINCQRCLDLGHNCDFNTRVFRARKRKSASIQQYDTLASQSNTSLHDNGIDSRHVTTLLEPRSQVEASCHGRHDEANLDLERKYISTASLRTWQIAQEAVRLMQQKMEQSSHDFAAYTGTALQIRALLLGLDCMFALRMWSDTNICACQQTPGEAPVLADGKVNSMDFGFTKHLSEMTYSRPQRSGRYKRLLQRGAEGKARDVREWIASRGNTRRRLTTDELGKEPPDPLSYLLKASATDEDTYKGPDTNLAVLERDQKEHLRFLKSYKLGACIRLGDRCARRWLRGPVLERLSVEFKSSPRSKIIDQQGHRH